jgi:branched-chain amino acid transport system substrate-binding protein
MEEHGQDARPITRKDLVGKFVGASVGGITVAGIVAGRAPKASAGVRARKKAQPYVIAHTVDLSHVLKADGADSRDGAAIAIKEINALGGVQGRPIEHFVVDTNTTTPDGITAGINLAIKRKPDAITTHFMAPSSAALEAVASYGAPYLNGNTSIDNVKQVESAPNRFWMAFQTDPTEVPYGLGIPAFLDSLERSGRWKPSSRRIYSLVADNVYNRTISKGLEDAVKKSNKWEMAAVENIGTSVKDWGAQLSKIRKARPGVITMLHYTDTETAAFMKQFVANPTKSLIYIQYAPSQATWIKLAGKAANGVTWATVTGLYQDSLGRAFHKKFTSAYKREPGIAYAGMHYDMVYMLARAWGRVGDPKDFKAVAQELRTMIHRGVQGGYYMNRPGQHVIAYPDETPDPSLGHAHLFFQIQNGKQVLIGPNPFASGKFQPAPWLK